MTQPDWSARLVQVIAGEVKRLRKDRDMSAQQLADACAEIGLPIARSVLANLENGRRDTVSVPELFVLAQALKVTPIRLLVPLGHEQVVEVAPGEPRTTTQVLTWLRGDFSDPTGLLEGDATVRDFVAHDREYARWTWSVDVAASIRAGEMEGTAQELERLDSDAERARISLETIRRSMRERNETPPPVRPGLRLEESARP